MNQLINESTNQQMTNDKKMQKRLLIILGIVTLLGGNSLVAQNRIEQEIKAASVYFDEGNVVVSLATLKKIENEEEMTYPQKIELYRQMTICYIFLNQEDSTDVATNMKLAKQTYLKLLNENNIYEPDSNDIIDYVRFTKKFTSKPLFVITPFAGLNTSFVDVLQYYGTGNLSDTNVYALNQATPYTPVFTNTTAGLNFNWNFYRAFSVEFGGAYTQRSYRYAENLDYGNLQSFKLNFTERQQWIDVSAVVKFDIGKSKTVIPYVYGGGTYNLLLTSNLNLIKRSFAELQPDLNIIDARYKSNVSLIGGCGVKLRVFGKHYLTIDGQYGRMIRKVNNINARFTSSQANDLTYNLGYIDNDIRLNNARITIGFAYAIYNPQMKE
jgi:hypothetical protein